MHSSAEEEKALNDFEQAIKDGCLNEFDDYCNEVNFFEILEMPKYEPKHTIFLAWLFDSNERHGFKDTIIVSFLRRVINKRINFSMITKPDFPKDILAKDFNKFFVYHELSSNDRRFDIILSSPKLETVIVIENKIDADESKNSDGVYQTETYRKMIKNKYANYKNFFYIFLTPDGRQAKDSEEYWCRATYSDIIEAVDDALRQRKNVINENVRFITENYVRTIERNIMGDKNIEKRCQIIYKNNKKAIDLIKDNNPDIRKVISKDLLTFVNDIHNQKEYLFTTNEITSKSGVDFYIRFITKKMRELVIKKSKPNDTWGWYPFTYEISINDSGELVFEGVCHDITEPVVEEIYKTSCSFRDKYTDVIPEPLDDYSSKGCPPRAYIKKLFPKNIYDYTYIEIKDEIMINLKDILENKIHEYEDDLLKKLKPKR